MKDFPAEPKSFWTLAGIEAFFTRKIKATQDSLNGFQSCENCQASRTDCHNDCTSRRESLLLRLQALKTVYAQEKSNFRLGAIPPNSLTRTHGHNPYENCGGDVGWSWSGPRNYQAIKEWHEKNCKTAKVEVAGLRSIEKRFDLCPAAAEILRKNLSDLRGFGIWRDVYVEIANAKSLPLDNSTWDYMPQA